VSHREEISEKLAIALDIKCEIVFGLPLFGDFIRADCAAVELVEARAVDPIQIRCETPPRTVHVDQ
jgi:hypothetical protein